MIKGVDNMGKSESIKKFEEALRNDELKRKTFEDAYKKILAEKSVGSNNEAVVKAAKEIGFDISIEELERSYAEKQEMNDDELDKVAGGRVDGPYCAITYECGHFYYHKNPGNNPDCFMGYFDDFNKQSDQ